MKLLSWAGLSLINSRYLISLLWLQHIYCIIIQEDTCSPAASWLCATWTQHFTKVYLGHQSMWEHDWSLLCNLATSRWSLKVTVRNRKDKREGRGQRHVEGLFKPSPPEALTEFSFIYILLHVSAEHPEEPGNTFFFFIPLPLCVSTFRRVLLNIFCRANKHPALSLSHLTLSNQHTHWV